MTPHLEFASPAGRYDSAFTATATAEHDNGPSTPPPHEERATLIHFPGITRRPRSRMTRQRRQMNFVSLPWTSSSLDNGKCSTLSSDSSEEEEVAELLLGMGSSFHPFTRDSDSGSGASTSNDKRPISSATLARKHTLPAASTQPRRASPKKPNAAKHKRAKPEATTVLGRCKCGKKISDSHPPCKSELMILCERFQEIFGRADPSGEPAEIRLNTAAEQLNVARRRLYDIINVLEAVEIISRTGKLTYAWNGKSHLPELLARLVEEESLGIPAVRVRKSFSGRTDDLKKASTQQGNFSLWKLTRHFVRLLLVRMQPVPLVEVASKLVGQDSEKRAQTLITVERRLYDIGSILSSIGLIEKTYLGHRQPAFCWSSAPGVPRPSSPVQKPAPPEAAHTTAAPQPAVPVKETNLSPPPKKRRLAIHLRETKESDSQSKASNEDTGHQSVEQQSQDTDTTNSESPMQARLVDLQGSASQEEHCTAVPAGHPRDICEPRRAGHHQPPMEPMELSAPSFTMPVMPHPAFGFGRHHTPVPILPPHGIPYELAMPPSMIHSGCLPPPPFGACPYPPPPVGPGRMPGFYAPMIVVNPSNAPPPAFPPEGHCPPMPHWRSQMAPQFGPQVRPMPPLGSVPKY